MEISYLYSSALKWQRNFHLIGISAACMIMLVGLAFIAAGLVRLDLLEVQGYVFIAMELAIALIVLGVLSIVSYAVVRAIEWASR
jgi:hypothetical protein